MNLNAGHILSLVNTILIALIAWFLHKQPDCAVVNTVLKEKTFIYDSTEKTLPVRQLPPVVTQQTVPVPVGINLDSLALKMFAIYTFSQVIENDTIRATIQDKISQNKIIDRSFKYQLLQPVRTVESTTITIPAKEKAGLVFGGFLESNGNIFGIGPRLGLETKKRIQIVYDFELLNKAHRIGLSKTFTR